MGMAAREMGVYLWNDVAGHRNAVGLREGGDFHPGRDSAGAGNVNDGHVNSP